MPPDHGALIGRLLAAEMRWPLADYRAALDAIDPALTAELIAQWGPPEDDPAVEDGAFRFRATRCGNLIVAAQPDRGARTERAAEYHDPHRPPRHSLVAFYLWLRHVAGTDALVHIGAHGTLEWLPGKSVALSSRCWPDVLGRRDAGDLSLHRQRPRRGRHRQAAARRGHHRPHDAAAAARAAAAGLRTVERLLDNIPTPMGSIPAGASGWRLTFSRRRRRPGSTATAASSPTWRRARRW